MSDAAAALEEAPKKKSKLPLLVGLVVMLALGGGGFYATWSGMILGGAAHEGDHAAEAPDPFPEIAFVPVEPVMVTLGPGSSARFLKLTTQLEVAKAYAGEVTILMPRILDVLNSYLRAVALEDLENPAAMARLRAQMLRRVQIVTGEGRVRDLLVTEFIVN